MWKLLIEIIKKYMMSSKKNTLFKIVHKPASQRSDFINSVIDLIIDCRAVKPLSKCSASRYRTHTLAYRL